MPTIRNIIIFVAVAAAVILAYIFFKPAAPTENLISSSSPVATSGTASSPATTASGVNNPVISQDLLNLLLSVESIELKDSLFSDPAFLSLHDSSIPLTPDGTEGRVNPFAPLGTDSIAPVAPTAQ